MLRLPAVLIVDALLLMARAQSQAPRETLLTPDNAYNPIPSPDGKYIAYVRTGWDRLFGGFGRSSLVSEVAVMDASGNLVAKNPVADAFLSGWTPDGTEMDAGGNLVAKSPVANSFLAGWTPDSTELVCYRDGEYSLVSIVGKHERKGRLPAATNVLGTERVSYLSRLGTVVWSQQDGFHTALVTPNGVLSEHDGWQGALIAPSPSGRYVAITGGWQHSHLWVYDMDRKMWVDLGEAEIHPDRDWDYIKPSWNPWFADGSRLAYFTNNNSVLSISTADGKRRTDIQINGTAGLAAPSPDGHYVAYVTFEPGPEKGRPDLQFWGGTRVWVVPLTGKPEPRLVTQKSLDETYGLRWLDDHVVVFDRVADVFFYKQARIWRAEVPR